MRIYFSPSEIGFYHESDKQAYLLAGTWPNDLLEISEKWFLYLLEGQQKGMVITVNDYDQPVLVDPPAPTKEQLNAEAEALKATLIADASETISILKDAVDLGRATKEEEALLLAWREYRISLNRIDTSNAPDIEWPVLPA
ncbi:MULTISPECIES: tail fiber assembly protein [Enterobacter]|uniref:Tail fiber assembly protein n=1 Tax=Enterobacter hormaechei TaxID=158836 RepID=A0A6L3Y1S5_9ENTR|nr:tail fiber assembly protein [Enterobacter sp. AN-K1]EKV3714250.1 tail fiber assembly protein [Enterobacter hormaechei]KAB2529018.1 tail fiber assembly protein [Enterobacter hormaechei]MCM7544551.1 tail fiber assembly protein [Enterobacter hormaechei]MCM7582964.1 tail fiber assembly protein [Enterobacter hormaechei]UFK53380.1 tail fiber assembly protein [Enterobacter sp. AN-K1]